MLRLAIFADIHGKFLLPFKLVHHYQTLTGNKIDWILQCGDMGAFPDKNRMDKATLRHAQKDRDELGFYDDFVTPKPEIAGFLNALNIPMYCVRGNHEDHVFLDELEQSAQHQPAFSIDCYQKVWVLKTGEPLILEKGEEQVSVLGVGRIGDRKARTHPEFIQAYEQQALKKLIKSVATGKIPEPDILITHDKASDSERANLLQNWGSAEIAELLDNIAFSHHFYGHTGEPFSQVLADNGITQSVKVKELEFDKNGKLEDGCMLLLEVEQKDGQKVFTLTPVPLDDIIQFMHATWHYL